MNSIEIITAVFGVILAVIGVTAKSGHTVGPNPTRLENRKAAILRKLDERIAHLQDEKACFQAATAVDAMKACREKFQTTSPAKQRNQRQPSSIQ